MKRAAVIILAAGMSLSLAACAGSSTDSTKEEESSEISEAAALSDGIEDETIEADVYSSQEKTPSQEARGDQAESDTETAAEENEEPEDYVVCVAGDNEDLLQSVNNAINILKENGTIDQIIECYMGDGSGEAVHYESPESTDYGNGSLVMAVGAERKPYEFYGEDGSLQGIDIEFATAICDLLGYRLEIKEVDDDAVVEAVEEGTADFGMVKTEAADESRENVVFSEVYTEGE